LSTLRFATRAKTVKNKAKLNEYQDEKFTIEEYKKEIIKLREELISKEAEKEKEILQHIIKSNENIAIELENYKGLYNNEKEKNENMKNEMENIKQTLVTLHGNKQRTNSQYSNNNTPFNQSTNSNFISSKENFFPNNNNPFALQSKNFFNDNTISGFNDANYSDMNINIQNEKNTKNGLKKYNLNNDFNANNNTGLNNNANAQAINYNDQEEENYIEKILKKINTNFLLEGNKKPIWQEEALKINTEYK